jgi:hypothetical protein
MMTAPKIERNKDLPERIEFTLVTGEKIAVIHSGNRIMLSAISGAPLLVHPESSNQLSVMIGKTTETAKLFRPEDYKWTNEARCPLCGKSLDNCACRIGE